MNNSEKLLSSFSEKIFYKELVYSNLKFIPNGGTEVELADLIINLEDIVLAIQLKERNKSSQSNDPKTEEKWLLKKCKAAKKQIKDTISYINNEELIFENSRGKRTRISSNAEIVPLIVFENSNILKYEHLMRNHSKEGLIVNCISMDDFKLMCMKLMSPIEIIDYIKWRQKFYEKNNKIDILITDTENGFFVSEPQTKENLVQQYLYEQYGEDELVENTFYLEVFRQYLSVLNEHTVDSSNSIACYEIVNFLAHLYRDEIKGFVERVKKAIEGVHQNGIVGSLENVKNEYVMIFISSNQGEAIPIKKLLPIVSKNQKVKKLLQVIVYHINKNEYKIYFYYYNENANTV